MKTKFYQCEICGQIVEVIRDTDAPLICCGQEMKEMVPASVDASQEKHVPVITIHGDEVTVKVGSAPHPMTQEHTIEWIVLKTSCGCQRKMLKPDMSPEACFRLCAGDTVKAAYAYCNLHGLWKTKAACAKQP